MSKSRRHDSSTLTFITIFLISSVALGSSATTTSTSFHRRDPLRQFKYYDGGYDLRNKHYWASAAFTGVHGYAMAGALLVCGLGCGIVLIIKNIVCKSSSDFSSATTANYSDFSYYLLFFLILLFSLLAMIATGFALAENQKTLQRTNKLKETVFGAGNLARRSIHRVKKAMNNIQNLLCTYDQSTCVLLNATGYQLGRESLTIQQFIQKNGHSIEQAIWSSYITNLVIVTVNLLFLVAGLVLLSLHWHPGLIIIIFLCWILTSACWVLTGVDFFVHTFAEDTCTSLQDFMKNPSNSSLSSLLPCTDALKSQTVIVRIGHTVHDFITQLNLNMNTIPKELGLTEVINDNVFGARKICDPFAGPPDYQYQVGKCPNHAIQIHDLPDILAKYTCDNDLSSESCLGSGRFLPKTTYLMAYAYIQSVQTLVNIYPDLENLIHCSFVKDQISEVVLHHQCKPFKVSTNMLWVSILCLSISMLVLVLLWVAKAYQDKGRYYSKFSILPRHEEP